MRPTALEATASRAGGEGDGTAAARGAGADRKRGVSGRSRRSYEKSRRQTILVAESSAIFRSAARSLFERRLGATVFDADDLNSVVAVAKAASPDVALIDVNLPPDGGVAAIARIRKVSPATKAIAWIASPSAATVHEAVLAGAVGCLEKELSADALHAALLGLEFAEAPISAKCAALLVAGVHADAERRRLAEQAARLTAREQEVLRLLAAGLRNREIAARLVITEATVKRHVSSVLRKLETRTRYEAAELYTSWGSSGAPSVDSHALARNGSER